jgi:hypothetical protein
MPVEAETCQLCPICRASWLGAPAHCPYTLAHGAVLIELVRCGMTRKPAS